MARCFLGAGSTDHTFAAAPGKEEETGTERPPGLLGKSASLTRVLTAKPGPEHKQMFR